MNRRCWRVGARRILAAGALSAILPAVAAGGLNLIRNGGFEEGEAPNYAGVGRYWETNDGQPHPDVDGLTTDGPHSGAWCQHLRAHPTWDLGMVRQVSGYNTVTPGKTYLIRAWVRTANVANPAGWYVFGAWWFNGDTYIGDSKMPRPDVLNYGWREISWTAVAPPSANRVAAVLTRHTDGDAWYDDVSIAEHVPGVPAVECAPATLEHRVLFGRDLPADTFSVRNSGGGTLSYDITVDALWLSTRPTAGESLGETDLITVHYAVAGLSLGSHTAGVSVSDTAASNSPQEIAVAVTVVQPGDLDADGDVDQADFGRFQACYSGPNVPPAAVHCTEARLDDDADVDGGDFTIFLACMSGPGIPTSPDCAALSLP